MISEIKEPGIIVIGYDDGRTVDQPLGVGVGINYIRFFPEQDFFVKLGVEGKPRFYNVRLRDFPEWKVHFGEIITRDVHPSRVIVVKMERQ